MIKSKKISFTKMTGTGNDFIVFDNREKLFSGEEKKFFAEICRRRVSVGADGILLLEKEESTPIRMRYFNSDGGEAVMCGNAARCAGFYAWRKKLVAETSFSLEALDGQHFVKIDENTVALDMVPPKDYRSDIGILKESGFNEGGFINTGVPHYVIVVKDANKVNVDRIAPYYRNHTAFSDGTNVNFVELMEENQIKVRTYERGVEGETLSCGTGCVASAIIAAKQFGYITPIKVLTRGGELIVCFNEGFNEVTLTGKVKIVYEGILVLS